MNAPVTAQATELQELNRSLDYLMSHIVALDRGPERELPPHPGPQTITQIAKDYGWDRKTTEAERFAMKLKYDPVREALAQAVRMLGKRLHEVGGMTAMRDACDRQEDMADGMRRTGIIDKRFDGIGDWCA